MKLKVAAVGLKTGKAPKADGISPEIMREIASKRPVTSGKTPLQNAHDDGTMKIEEGRR